MQRSIKQMVSNMTDADLFIQVYANQLKDKLNLRGFASKIDSPCVIATLSEAKGKQSHSHYPEIASGPCPSQRHTYFHDLLVGNCP